jgi:hypothetical protein
VASGLLPPVSVVTYRRVMEGTVEFDINSTAAAAKILREVRTAHVDSMPLPAWQLLLRAENRLNEEIQRYLCEEPPVLRLLMNGYGVEPVL